MHAPHHPLFAPERAVRTRALFAVCALASVVALFPEAVSAQSTAVEGAFKLVGERAGLVIGWARNILFTAVVGGLMWSVASWIGTGRVQLKPILITLVAGVMLAIAQGMLTFFVRTGSITGSGTAGAVGLGLPDDILQ